MPDEPDPVTVAVLADHESRLRVVEGHVQGFIARERGILLSLSAQAKIILLLFGFIGAIGAVVGIAHALA